MHVGPAQRREETWRREASAELDGSRPPTTAEGSASVGRPASTTTPSPARRASSPGARTRSRLVEGDVRAAAPPVPSHGPTSGAPRPGRTPGRQARELQARGRCRGAELDEVAVGPQGRSRSRRNSTGSSSRRSPASVTSPGASPPGRWWPWAARGRARRQPVAELGVDVVSSRGRRARRAQA